VRAKNQGVDGPCGSVEETVTADHASRGLPVLVTLWVSTWVGADVAVEMGQNTMSQTPPAVGTNRLDRAISPYLRQHAHNPVDWYEWGPEALARAQREDKPIFLSIGYAACHWCHVMAHESFENPEVAAVLNANFISIKVDREERPDLDDIYMQATLALNRGQGGWPMSVWLTPERKPFFAGTYFPPTSRYGRPGFKELSEAIVAAWRDHRAEIAVQAERLTGVIREGLQTPRAGTAELTLGSVDQAAEVLAEAFDAVNGGLLSGQTNKFPPSMALDLLMRSAVRRAADAARRQQFLGLTELTLDHMAAGGIYDQLGGGFHRYSTDAEWHVPHFEKMLYDQALLSRIYLDAYQLVGKPRYARVAREVLDYVLDDLRSPDGTFYGTRDADSEGIEGRYYVWTRAEVLAALGPDDGELFCAHYDVREAGNWQDPHAALAPQNVLRQRREPECCAKMLGIAIEEFDARITRARAKLLAVRAQRVPPALDDKILCEWNGLMIASLARGGCVLGDRRYIDAAARAAQALLDKQYRDGRLLRSLRAGQTLGMAFLSDYAGLIEGLIELYEATFEKRWLVSAADLNRTVIEHYWDDGGGGFFFAASDHEELLARAKDARDGAVPSGNSVQLMNLLRLSALLGDQKLRVLADKTMAAFAGHAQASPWSAERFLCGVDFACAGAIELTVVGDPAEPATQALLKQIYGTYLPNRVLMLHDPERPGASVQSPLLAQRALVDGRPAVYVCRDYACQRPVMTVDELTAALQRWSQGLYP
jgi:uncharacterized protein YyaL (SSP411 family)